MANGWTRETIEEIDRIANAPGQPEPKFGQGRTWLARAQHEGWCERVDGRGTAPESERRPENIPEHVHDRNARRRAETALATGRCQNRVAERLAAVPKANRKVEKR